MSEPGVRRSFLRVEIWSFVVLASAGLTWLASTASPAHSGESESRESCEPKLKQWNERAVQEEIGAIARERSHANYATALELYGRLRKNRAFMELFPAQAVYPVLTDPEMPYYVNVLVQMMSRLDAARARINRELISKTLAETLSEIVPGDTLRKRIEALKKDPVANIRRALGDLTLEEAQVVLHGGNPLKPSPESWVGRYLKESGAATLRTGFPRSARGSGGKDGPKRLVIAVSQQSFGSFQKYFFRENLFSVHAHAYISHHGKLVSYMHRGVDFRLPSVGYILPQVLLKTSEAQRLTQFFKLLHEEESAGRGYVGGNVAMYPWELAGYCKRGGYAGNCTAWIANIPVGDKRVAKYSFPANFEARGPHRPVHTQLGSVESDRELVQRVWKTPGHEQLADVIGLRRENLLGEMASPGYLVHSLLAKAPVDRVPIVFLVVDDHQAKIHWDFEYTAEDAD